MTRDVQDNTALLAQLMKDSVDASADWRPKARWHGYAMRIANEIERAGLENFRTNFRLLKGFTTGGNPLPDEPRNPLKKAIWRAVAGLPVVARILSEERHLVAAEHQGRMASEIGRAQLVLSELERSGLTFQPPEGLANGGAEDAFEWNGHLLTPVWVEHLMRAVELYQKIPTESVDTIFEVGSGLAQTTLAHVALNPKLKWIVNVDIPPVLYIASQYLRSIPGVEVVDYTSTRDLDRIVPAAAQDGRTRIYMLPPWQTSRLDAEADLFLNAASFQEMDRESCAAYAMEANRITKKWAVLICGGRTENETPDPNVVGANFVLDLFGDKFDDQETCSGSWQKWYRHESYLSHYFARNAA